MLTLWSTGDGSLQGLALAREPGWVFVWDSTCRLTLLNARGAVQCERRATEPFVSVRCADDGSCSAAVIRSGRVWIFDRDLRTRWEQKTSDRPTALAVETYGNYLAVADSGGWLQLYDAGGRQLWRKRVQAPLHRLTFVAEKPLLLGCAERSLVVCFDMTGEVVWRDAPFASLDSLSVTGDGRLIALAGFSEGFLQYDASGRKANVFPETSSCKRVALSYDGERRVTEDLVHQVELQTRKGKTLARCTLDSPSAGLALDALGRYVLIATAEGKLLELKC